MIEAEATIIKEETGKCFISCYHLIEWINLDKIKSNERSIEWRYAFIRVLLNLLVWSHEVIGRHVHDIADL